MIMTSKSFALLLFNKSIAELANNSQAKQKQNHMSNQISIWEKVSILDCSDFNPQEGVLPIMACTESLRLQQYERIGISQVEVYERVGK